MNSWLITTRPLTISDPRPDRADDPMGADPGGQHRQELVVPLHPGDREDRRHHADDAAEPVVELAHVDQVIPAHDREQFDEPFGTLRELVEITRTRRSRCKDRPAP